MHPMLTILALDAYQAQLERDAKAARLAAAASRPRPARGRQGPAGYRRRRRLLLRTASRA